MLKKNSYIPKILSKTTDGVDYISIIKPATELGKMLNSDYQHNIDTMFGNVVSIRRIMEYLNRDKYPSSFLTKPRLTKSDISIIKALTIKHIDNYWAFILYFMIKRVASDPKLIELMKNNSLEYAALDTGTVTDQIFNQEIMVKKHITKLSYYISCIRIISILVKEDKIHDNSYISSLLEMEVEGNFLDKISDLNNIVSIA